MDLIKSKTLQKGSDFVKVNADEALKDKKFVGFYFSAHWCPPCRGFTPVLKDFYEVIFHFFLRNKFSVQKNLFVLWNQDSLFILVFSICF